MKCRCGRGTFPPLLLSHKMGGQSYNFMQLPPPSPGHSSGEQTLPGKAEQDSDSQAVPAPQRRARPPVRSGQGRSGGAAPRTGRRRSRPRSTRPGRGERTRHVPLGGGCGGAPRTGPPPRKGLGQRPQAGAGAAPAQPRAPAGTAASPPLPPLRPLPLPLPPPFPSPPSPAAPDRREAGGTDPAAPLPPPPPAEPPARRAHLRAGRQRPTAAPALASLPLAELRLCTRGVVDAHINQTAVRRAAPPPLLSAAAGRAGSCSPALPWGLNGVVEAH